jgi:surface antigen
VTRMGMDTDVVEQSGRQLKSQAANIGSLIAQLDKLVNSLPSVWDGQDAQQFVRNWWPQHKKALAAAQQSVDGLGQSALNNASEQRHVSSTNGASSASAAGVTAAAAATAAATGARSAGASTAAPTASGSPGDVRTQGKETHVNPAAKYVGQCTYGAYEKWFDATGDQYYPAFTGNAKDMPTTAAQAGYSVTNVPHDRAMVVFQPGVHYADATNGHVAWVDSVQQKGNDTYVTVSEMNYKGDPNYETHTYKNVQGMSYILAP